MKLKLNDNHYDFLEKKYSNSIINNNSIVYVCEKYKMIIIPIDKFKEHRTFIAVQWNGNDFENIIKSEFNIFKLIQNKNAKMFLAIAENKEHIIKDFEAIELEDVDFLLEYNISNNFKKIINQQIFLVA